MWLSPSWLNAPGSANGVTSYIRQALADTYAGEHLDAINALLTRDCGQNVGTATKRSAAFVA
jgi:hypothetical protein